MDSNTQVYHDVLLLKVQVLLSTKISSLYALHMWIRYLSRFTNDIVINDFNIQKDSCKYFTLLIIIGLLATCSPRCNCFNLEVYNIWFGYLFWCHRYPAGFVYIYLALYYITSYGHNIRLGQYLFAGLYMLSLIVLFDIYRKTKRVCKQHYSFKILMKFRKTINSIP